MPGTVPMGPSSLEIAGPGRTLVTMAEILQVNYSAREYMLYPLESQASQVGWSSPTWSRRDEEYRPGIEYCASLDPARRLPIEATTDQ